MKKIFLIAIVMVLHTARADQLIDICSRGVIGLAIADKLNSKCNQVSQQELSGVRTLDLQSHKIEEIAPGAFNGLTSLKSLDLSGNKISEISNDAFEGLSSLQSLDLSSNPIALIGPDAFRGLNSLEDVILKSTLHKFHLGALGRLPRLARLDLSYNEFLKIEFQAFKGFPALSELLLNGVNSVEKGAFVDLVALQTLELGSAQLNSIVIGTFKGLNSLKELHLRSNRIEPNAFEDLPNLRKLNLDMGYGIGYLYKDTFVGLARLGKLYVYAGRLFFEKGSFNGLHTIDEVILEGVKELKIEKGQFAGLSTLKTLEIKDATIFEIENGAFEDLAAIVELDLSRNKIRKITSQTFAGLSSTMRALNLDYNPIESIEPNAFLNVFAPEDVEQDNNFELNLRGINLNSISRSELGIPEYVSISGPFVEN